MLFSALTRHADRYAASSYLLQDSRSLSDRVVHPPSQPTASAWNTLKGKSHCHTWTSLTGPLHELQNFPSAQVATPLEQ